MGPKYPSSRSREPVREVRMNLCASLETAIGQASGFSLLGNDNPKRSCDHVRNRKQKSGLARGRELHFRTACTAKMSLRNEVENAVALC